MTFFTSNACRRAGASRCRLCRQPEAGRQWRAAMLAAFGPYAAAPDFPCPKGLPWQWRAVQTIPPDAERICRACHQARHCPNATTCCGGRLTIHITVPCPHSRW